MFSLLKYFSWSYFRYRPLKVFLTLLGMAAGIAVFASIQISNQSVLSSFSRSLNQMSGQSDIRISPRTRPIKIQDIRTLNALPHVEALSPTLSRYGECGSLPIQVLGFDPIQYGRMFPESGFSLPSDDWIRLIGRPGTALLPKSLAAKCGLQDSEKLTLTLSGEKQSFEPLIYEDGGTPWENSDLIFVDLATFQEKISTEKLAEQIDLKIQGITTEEWLERYSSDLESGLMFSTSEAQYEEGANILKAFQNNLLSLGLVSIFVAVFIIYSATSLSVVYRQKQLALLRCLGLSRRRLGGLLIAESLVFGSLAALLGSLLGWLLAKLIFSKIVLTVNSLYLQQISAQLNLTWESILWALLIGVGASLLGSLIPLWGALKISPVSSFHSLEMEKDLKGRMGKVLLLALFSVILCTVSIFLASIENPYWAYGAAFGVLLLFLSLTPLGIRLGLIMLRPLANGLRSVNLKISNRQLQENPYRYSVVTGSLALAMALWLGIGFMVHSFRETVLSWLDTNVQGHVYLTFRDNPQNDFQTFVPEEVYQRAKELPNVKALDVIRSFPVRLGTEEVNVSAIQLRRLMAAGQFQILSGERDRFLQDKLPTNGPDLIAVSESFARRRNLAPGDKFEIQSIWGPWPFQVGAILYDYSSESGLIYLDIADFQARTQDRRINGLAFYLADPSQAPPLVNTLRNFPKLPLTTEIRLQKEIHQRVLAIFDQTFQVTKALRLVALLVAFLGILSTLAILIEEKRWELGLLRSLGMGRGQVSRFGLVQGLSLAWGGFCLGALAGMALCWIIMKVIHYNFFGWTLFFHWDFGLLLQGLILTLLTGGLASTWAVYKVSQYPLTESLGLEH